MAGPEDGEPIDVDMRISYEDGQCGYKRIEICALSPEAEVTLAEEFTRIMKLLERPKDGPTA